MKYEKEFREAYPETIGETDKAFDLSNYTDWLEKQLSDGIIPKLVKQVKKWEKDSEDHATAFRKAKMNASLMSSTGMAQAYWNVLTFIDVNK